MNMPKSLAETEVGETVRVVSLLAEGRMRRRLADLGLIPGAEVTCLGRSPLGEVYPYGIDTFFDRARRGGRRARH